MDDAKLKFANVAGKKIEGKYYSAEKQPLITGLVK